MSQRLGFKTFDEYGKVDIYYNGFLPHWRQRGCTYFVTFRLADSVPQAVLDEWLYERNRWLTARGLDLRRIELREAMHRLSKQDQRLFERYFAGKLFDYLDRGHGDCVLRNAEASQLVADSLCHFHGQRLETGDFVVMPNHVHALITPLANYELQEILHSIKSYTANQINRLLGRTETLWMEESYDHIVRDTEELLRIQSYIRANPEKTKLRADEYRIQTAEYELSY